MTWSETRWKHSYIRFSKTIILCALQQAVYILLPQIQEVEVIEELRSMLHQKVHAAFQQICVLQDCHRQLHFDLTDKQAGFHIDSESFKLTNKSDNIAMQTDPTRIMKE